MENMKKRYDYENELLHAFSLELTHKALSMRATFNEVAHKSRLSDSHRKMKKYCIIMNNLLRKDAEKRLGPSTVFRSSIF